MELYETCLGLGFALGPLIGGLLGQISWRVPFFACGVFMIGALVISLTKLSDPPQRPAPLTVRRAFAAFRRPAFVIVSIVVATYNFVFFTVLGFGPVALGLGIVPLGLVFTGWGVGLAVGILVVGHRMAHRIGAVPTVGIAFVVLLATLVGLAVSPATWFSVAMLVVAGLCMGVTNANVTDLALATGDPERRVTTGAFNVVRWGFAAPTPVVSGLLAEHVGMSSPFWVAAVVLAAGIAVLAIFGRRITAAASAEAVEAAQSTPEEAMAEL